MGIESGFNAMRMYEERYRNQAQELRKAGDEESLKEAEDLQAAADDLREGRKDVAETVLTTLFNACLGKLF